MTATYTAAAAQPAKPKARPRQIHPSVPHQPLTTDPVEMLKYADIVLINSSGGKDSQAMLSYVFELARTHGLTAKIVVVHADLEDGIEWPGTRELAELQARLLGIRRFEVVKAEGGNLLARVRERYGKLKAKADAEGKPVAPAWPSSSARWCTSDLKRGPIRKLMTALVAEHEHLGRPVRILNCIGQRGEESTNRAKLAAVEVDRPASNGRRHVTVWRPIHQWREHQVWTEIARSALPYHEAYDWGMRRLSCSFCVLGCAEDVVLAARLRPDVAAQYADMELYVETDFKQGLSMREIIRRAQALDSQAASGHLVRPAKGTAMTNAVGRKVAADYMRRLTLAA